VAAQIGKVLHLLGELGITPGAQVSVDIPPGSDTKALQPTRRRRERRGRYLVIHLRHELAGS